MTLSNHFKLSLAVIACITVTLLSVGACLERRLAESGHRDSAKVSATVLPKLDKEQIIVDPFHHTIQVVTSSGVKQTTLPDRPTKIDILKDGTVKITASQFGTELRPFLGVGFTLRSGVVLYGVDLLYWKKLDLGLGFSTSPTRIQDTSIFLGVSYNVWSNTSISLGVDNRQTPMIGIHVRL